MKYFWKCPITWRSFLKSMGLRNSAVAQLYVYDFRRFFMDIAKYPQYQLYLLTLHLFMLKNQLVPNMCDNRFIDSTIINRAYFSSYLFSKLWLEDVKKFKPTPIEIMEIEERISEHLQIRNALYNFGEKRVRSDLTKLANLRKKLIMILLLN